MWARKQKKSESDMVRVKNTEQAIKHPDKNAMEWMKRKPYETRAATKRKGDASAEQNEI